MNPASQNESIRLWLPVPGTYFAYVSGSATAVQMYQLDVSVTAAATVSIAGTTAGTETGPVNGVFTVTQTAQTAVETVLTYLVSGTSAPDSGFTALSGSVTISAGSTSATITVPVIDDSMIEGTEAVTLTLTGVANSAPGVTVDAANDVASIDILDNDSITVQLFVPTDLTSAAGGTVTVPVMVDVMESAEIDLAVVDLAIQFDSTKFTAGNFQLGTLLAGAGFDAPVVNTSTPGVLAVTTSSPTGTSHLPQGTRGSVFLFDLTVAAEAAAGPSRLNFLSNLSTTFTALSNRNTDELTLSPPPTNADSDSVDGLLTVDNGEHSSRSLARCNTDIHVGGGVRC